VPADLIARAVSPRGEIVLRRRPADGEVELRVNGVFVMDTSRTATERALGERAVAALRDRLAPGAAMGPTAVIGGLGLGFTLLEIAACPLFGSIVVAEIEPSVVEWHRTGLVGHTADVLKDPRVCVVTADVRDVVEARPAASVDVLVLDVDNGPGYLVYDNAALYESAFLTTCREALSPDGRLVVWSAAAAPAFEGVLRSVFGSVEHHVTPVLLGSRHDSYHAYSAPAPALAPAPAPPGSHPT